jgi:hypothetical protein
MIRVLLPELFARLNGGEHDEKKPTPLPLDQRISGQDHEIQNLMPTALTTRLSTDQALDQWMNALSQIPANLRPASKA